MVENNDTTNDLKGQIAALAFLVLLILRPLFAGGLSDDFGVAETANMLLAAAPLIVLGIVYLSKQSSARIPAANGILLLFGATVVSSVFGQDHFSSAEKTVTLTGSVAFALLAAEFVRNEEDRRQMAGAMVFSALILLVYGLYARGHVAADGLDFSNPADLPMIEDRVAAEAAAAGKPISTLINPEIFSGFIAMVVFLAYGFFRSSKSFIGKALGLSAVVLSVIELYLAGSVGGWWAAAVGLGCYIFFAATDRKKAIKHAAAIIVVASLAAFAISARKAGTIDMGVKRVTPASETIAIWKGCIKGAVRHPILGVGPGNFKNSYFGAKDETANFTNYAHAHWLQQLIETGILGMAGMLLVFFYFFKGAIGGAAPEILQPGDRKIVAAMAAGGAAFIAHGFIQFGMEIPGASAFFWALVGVVASGAKQVSLEGQKMWRARRIAVGAILLVLGVLNILLIPGGIFLQMGKQAVADNDLKIAYLSLTSATKWRPCDFQVYLLIDDAWPETEFQGSRRKLEALNAALTCSPENPLVWIRLGQQQFKMDNYPEALKTFDGAEQRAPSWDIARGWRRLANAKILMTEKKYKAARAEYESVLQEFPGHPNAISGLEELDQLEKSANQ